MAAKESNKAIFFKYLKDTVKLFINPNHEFDPEVVELFQLSYWKKNFQFHTRSNVL